MLSVCKLSSRSCIYNWMPIKRCLSISTSIHCNKPTSPLQESLKDFTPVYKMQFIGNLGIINRLKLYQAAATAIGIPTSLILSTVNIISQEAFFMTCALGISGTITLFTFGLLTNKLVGFLYFNKEQNIVRIAYLDFWGNRRDDEMPKTDVIPICMDMLRPTEKIYYKLKRYSVDQTYVLTFTHGEIIDKETFKHVFAVN